MLEFATFALFKFALEDQKRRRDKMMAVAAAQKNREMFAIKKSYSIEVNH